ncbi:MAG: rhomboid family intramembrane serine protease [Eubacteriales bacterium]|nr:rhomboid family intramembrane serine protease [Eubacteriales bacterium]
MEKSMFEEAIDFIKSRKKMNLAIILANIVVFIVMEMMGDTADVQFMAEHGAMLIPASWETGEIYRLFTAMFLHFGIEHIFYNMLMLIFIGDMLETYVGSLRYLLVYLGGGLIGNVASAVIGTERIMRAAGGTMYWTVAAGASGAVFAAVGGLVVIALRNRGRNIGLDSRRLVLMAALTLFGGIRESGVDHVAHIAGFLGGALVCAVVTLRLFPASGRSGS